MDWEPHAQGAYDRDGGGARGAADAWLDSASRYRLLSAAEEVACGQAIERGGKDAPSPVCDARAGCCRTARETLIHHNLRLVVDVAKRYNGLGATCLTREDLWQYGVEGLMKAAMRYDYRRGFKFATAATWWIRQAIGRAMVNEGYAVNEPQYVVTERANAFRRGDDYPERIIPDTLHRPVLHYDPNSDTLADVLEDKGALAPFAAVDEADQERELVRALLAHCTRREAVILALRMHGETLERIGNHIGMSRERVRQIQADAIRKLRVALVYEPNNGGLRERAGMIQYVQDSIWQASRHRARAGPTTTTKNPPAARQRLAPPSVTDVSASPPRDAETREPLPASKPRKRQSVQAVTTTTATSGNPSATRRRAPSSLAVAADQAQRQGVLFADPARPMFSATAPAISRHAPPSADKPNIVRGGVTRGKQRGTRSGAGAGAATKHKKGA